MSPRWVRDERSSRVLLTVMSCVGIRAGEIQVHLSCGHRSAKASPFQVRPSPATNGVELRDVTGEALEPGEGLRDGAWLTTTGAGDVDGVRFILVYPDEHPLQFQNLQINGQSWTLFDREWVKIANRGPTGTRSSRATDEQRSRPIGSGPRWPPQLILRL